MLALLALLGPPQSVTPGPRVPEDVIVCLPRARDRAALDDRLALENAAVVEELPALGLLRVRLTANGDEATLARLRRVPGVAYVEWNGQGEGGDVPDDTSFPAQWPLANTGQSGGTVGADIDALRGWELTRGSPAVIVAVLDSGLDAQHVEFAGRTLPGRDCVNEDDDPADDQGHGTEVAGILAASADNAFGIAGVDPSCTILPVKVLNRLNVGTAFDLSQGLTFAADAGADVVNLSLINFPASQALRDALQYARDAGCILVACAGNGGIGDADESFPGRSPLTIAVGATTRTDDRASFSGTGQRLDLVAPGQGVPATSRSANDTVRTFSGCSAATPHVSGIVALALSIDPTLTHDEVRERLVASAEDLVGPPDADLPGRDDQFGHGRVNLFRMLCTLDAGGPTIAAPQPITVECDRPEGLAGDAPGLVSALGLIAAFDDLDPEPDLALEVPPFLPLGGRSIVVVRATDACGNGALREVEVRVVDTVAPALGLTIAPVVLPPRAGTLVPLTIDAPTSDACDRAPEVELLVLSDEPAARRGELDVRFHPEGEVALHAERSPTGNGRVFLLIARATDDSGNRSTRCAAAVVPFDDSPLALESVLAEARAAREVCEATGEAPREYSPLGSIVLPKNPATPRPARR